MMPDMCLRDTIDSILGGGAYDLVEYSCDKPLKVFLKEEEQRHRAALKEIYRKIKS